MSAAAPAPGDISISVTPKISIDITEDAATLKPSSIKILLNGSQVTLPTGAISKSGKVTTMKYSVTQPLAAKADQTLHLEFSDSAGHNVARDWKFTTGNAAGGNLANAVKGQWDFDNGDLRATVGRELHLIDDALISRYQFGTTAQFGVPNLNGKPARVLYVPFTDRDETDATGPVFRRIGLRMQHAMPPNGGGKKVNQWTLIMDVFWGTNGPSGFGSILQTRDLDNPTDGDMFWRASDGYYGKGCCSLYDGVAGVSGPGQMRGEWARVVFVADLSSSPLRLAKFINGQKHREDLSGDGNALDSRFALPVEILLFGDGDDDERTDCFVNAIQFREGALSDEEVVALGGASAYGIPGAPGGAGVAPPLAAPPQLQVGRAGNDLKINLIGGQGSLTLQRRADFSPGTSWQDVGPVSGASLTITNAFTGAQAYFRIRAQ